MTAPGCDIRDGKNASHCEEIMDDSDNLIDESGKSKYNERYILFDTLAD